MKSYCYFVPLFTRSLNELCNFLKWIPTPEWISSFLFVRVSCQRQETLKRAGFYQFMNRRLLQWECTPKHFNLTFRWVQQTVECVYLFLKIPVVERFWNLRRIASFSSRVFKLNYENMYHIFFNELNKFLYVFRSLKIIFFFN